MSYREPPRISNLATVLRYYAAIIESEALGPPPEHLLSAHETVEAFRYLAMVLDLEAGERLAGIYDDDGTLDGALPTRQSLPNFEQRFQRLAAAVAGAAASTGALPERKPVPDLAEQIRKRRLAAETSDDTPPDDGEGGGIGSRLSPGMAPRLRRRRGPQ